MSIREGKLIYHLTDIQNVQSIIENGLLPRKTMFENGFYFQDVADQEILHFREEYDLNKYVPFHFFGCNPFDGKVQLCHPQSEFVYFCIHRNYARTKGFQIIPKHPLNMKPFIMYNYDDGMEKIEWDKMEVRDYSDYECKEICMAECVYDGSISIHEFSNIYVKTEANKRYVDGLLEEYGINNLYVNVNPNLFLQ